MLEIVKFVLDVIITFENDKMVHIKIANLYEL
jgi:hypothetical protein